ncbi:hypothetical protein [Sulfuracidifex metallicus]|uniref:hypothetical protein n=1 Tax=Sulfuracidifex metallicus TaxID=47303 RepID=UPI003B8498F2
MAASTTVYIAVIVILIILAAIGFGLYATKSVAPVTSTSVSTVTSVSTTTVPTTVTSSTTATANVTTTVTSTTTTTKTATVTSLPPSDEILLNDSGTLYNNMVITQHYTANYACENTSSVQSLFSGLPGQEQQSTDCEVGVGVVPSGTLPLFVLTPAYAGLSIFGYQPLGATPEGFPTFTYNGTTHVVLTNCPGMGASNPALMCVDHPFLLYSPYFTAVEQHLGIKNGLNVTLSNGQTVHADEGVLFTPAHTHLIATSTGNSSIGWYLVVVLVMDPNIMPNPITGQCQDVVPSNLTDPTANCLTNITSLEHAMTTYDSAVIAANANNPIWQTLNDAFHVGGLQVIVPGLNSPADLMNTSNTNVVLYFSTPNMYPPNPI